MKKLVIILLLALPIVGIFYWFELRPSNIVKECAQAAKVETSPKKGRPTFGMEEEYEKKYNQFYKNCLRENGINE